MATTNYETKLATAIRKAVEKGENGLLEEALGEYIFAFNVTARVRRETATTGVEFMGERETYIRETYTVDIEYLGVDWYEDEPAVVALDLAEIARQIENENDDATRMAVVVYDELKRKINR